jgi:hypothetical protein
MYKYNSICRDLVKKGISHPCFFGDVIDKQFKSDKKKNHLASTQPWFTGLLLLYYYTNSIYRHIGNFVKWLLPASVVYRDFQQYSDYHADWMWTAIADCELNTSVM